MPDSTLALYEAQSNTPLIAIIVFLAAIAAVCVLFSVFRRRLEQLSLRIVRLFAGKARQAKKKRDEHYGIHEVVDDDEDGGLWPDEFTLHIGEKGEES